MAFFAIVFALYYIFRKKKVVQNVILLSASYVFYAMASIKIVPIILLMTLLVAGDYIWEKIVACGFGTGLAWGSVYTKMAEDIVVSKMQHYK